MVPPPSNHPLARYFASNEDLQFYEARLAGRKEIPPRYLDPTLLVIHKFDTLKAILVHQGLMDFVQIKSKYYPDLVAIAYSTLMIEIVEEDESNFTSVRTACGQTAATVPGPSGAGATKYNYAQQF